MSSVPGSKATRPGAIPLAGWKQILLRVWREAGEDHISLIAAGVAFYGLLALFPAITAFVAISGLVLEPSQITDNIDMIAAMMPERAAEIVVSQATAVAGSAEAGLGLAAAFGIALSLYSASKGVRSLVEGLNIAYDESDDRGLIKGGLLVLALTLLLMVGMVLGIGATLVLPPILSVVDLGATTELLISLARWAVLFVMTVAGIAVLYRYGPDRTRAQWMWLTPGAVVACIGWLVASILFARYTDNFANYNESFGSLAGIIVLLTWLWISAYVILLGAELDAEIEAQTREDTTTGPTMPLGARGAVKADTAAGDESET